MVVSRVTPQSRVTDRSLSSASNSGASTLPALPTAAQKTIDVPVLVPVGTKGPDAATAAKRSLHALRGEMLDVLHEVAAHFRLRYGPIEYKRAKFGWDIDAAETAGTKRIAEIVGDSSKTRDQMVEEFQGLLRDFTNGSHDYHVSITFNRLAQARLPFRVQPADGRFFICGIDRAQASKESFPFEVGDEVTSFDGKPVGDIVESLKAYTPLSNAMTDLREAASMLTTRRSRLAEPLPEKTTATIGIKRKNGTTRTVELGWNTKKESVIFQQPGTRALELRKAAFDHVGPDMTAYRYIDADNIAKATDDKVEADGFVVGGRKTFVPELGPIVSKTSDKDPFNAYIYRAPNGKNIGVIRIPEFGPDEPEELVKAFTELVAQYEKGTDALIIDQNNNPGGYFFYMMALLSTLSPNAMKMTGQAEAITPQEVYDAQLSLQTYAPIKDDKSARKVLGKTLVGMPVSYDLVVKMRTSAQHIIDQWNAGKTLTDSFPLEGVGSVNPSSEAVYTKPILCLVNSICYSCGDFFPAALQTNGRARIFGETTAGAGGYVLTHNFVNGLGIEALRTTGSIADRGTVAADGTVTDDPSKLENPIESKGIEPDVPYTISASDMQDGFKDYAKAVNAEIVKMTS